jgi:hypothetical protein
MRHFRDKASPTALSAECRPQFLPSYFELFWNYTRLADHGHEIGVAQPPRQHVKM